MSDCESLLPGNGSDSLSLSFLRDLVKSKPLFGLDRRSLEALLEEVESAKAYLDAPDDDPELAEKFQRWLRAQAVFTG